MFSKRRLSLYMLPLALLLPLLGAFAFLGTRPEMMASVLRGNTLALDQALAPKLTVNAQLCYHDPQLQVLSTQSGIAGDGAFAATLNYCPSQQAYFGRFSLLETNQSLTSGGCFYIQNDTTAHGSQSGFQLTCPKSISPGDLTTAPNIDDGHPWQACWIDYAPTTPRPACTSFKTFQ